MQCHRGKGSHGEHIPREHACALRGCGLVPGAAHPAGLDPQSNAPHCITGVFVKCVLLSSTCTCLIGGRKQRCLGPLGVPSASFCRRRLRPVCRRRASLLVRTLPPRRAQDNLLAVATARSVILLSAGDLGGPRSVVDVPVPTVGDGTRWVAPNGVTQVTLSTLHSVKPSVCRGCSRLHKLCRAAWHHGSDSNGSRADAACLRVHLRSVPSTIAPAADASKTLCHSRIRRISLKKGRHPTLLSDHWACCTAAPFALGACLSFRVLGSVHLSQSPFLVHQGAHRQCACILPPSALLTEGWRPQEQSEEEHLAFMAQALARGPHKLRVGAGVRSAAWSPPGAAATGGCILSVVSEAHKARLVPLVPLALSLFAPGTAALDCVVSSSRCSIRVNGVGSAPQPRAAAPRLLR